MKNDKIVKSERYINGVDQMNRVSPGIEDNAMNSIEVIAPFFKQYVIESFGDLFSRTDKLSLQQRELVIISSIASLGHSLPQLEFHIDAALNVGCAISEIVEVVTTVALYAGVPAALNAMRVAVKVFEDHPAT